MRAYSLSAVLTLHCSSIVSSKLSDLLLAKCIVQHQTHDLRRRTARDLAHLDQNRIDGNASLTVASAMGHKISAFMCEYNMIYQASTSLYMILTTFKANQINGVHSLPILPSSLLSLQWPLRWAARQSGAGRGACRWQVRRRGQWVGSHRKAAAGR
jgi:hypothetical protein